MEVTECSEQRARAAVSEIRDRIGHEAVITHRVSADKSRYGIDTETRYEVLERLSTNRNKKSVTPTIFENTQQNISNDQDKLFNPFDTNSKAGHTFTLMLKPGGATTREIMDTVGCSSNLVRSLVSTISGHDQQGKVSDFNVIEERPLSIFLNSQEIVTAMTIGDYPEYLALGFLRNQNLLKPEDQITGIDYDEELKTVIVRTKTETNYEQKLKRKIRTSGCAVGTVFGDMMESIEDVQKAVSDCNYPPNGRRGIGGERATAWGQCLKEHTAEANENVLVIPMIESIDAVPNVANMCKVDGVEIFFFGPADFSSTAGFRGQWEGPGIAEKILELKNTIKDAGKYCGVVSTSNQNLTDRLDQGFQMLAIGTDGGLMLRSLHESLKKVNRDRSAATSLDPVDGHDLPNSNS